MSDVRFFLDEHLPRALAESLRRLDIEAAMAHEAGRRTQADTEHLAWATREGWVIVTVDDDFLSLAKGREHAGIVFCVPLKRSLGERLRRLQHIWQTETRASIANRIHYI